MISFIIPTLQSDVEYLYNCIASIEMELSRYRRDSEIIVVAKVDEDKQDKFYKKLQSFGSLECYFSDGNRSEARNLGITKTKNEILTLIDSDTIIGENFIPITIDHFKKGFGYINYSTRPLYLDVIKRRRLYYYSRFMNLNQWFYTHVGYYRPAGYCMSVKKSICQKVFKNGETFSNRLAGYGEDALFGSLYGKYCLKNRIRGKYEKKVKVYTSFREWYQQGLWNSGARMMINTWLVPIVKRPVVANWKDKNIKCCN